MSAVAIERVGGRAAVATAVLLSVVIALAGLGVGPIHLGRVKGTSMLPTLHAGDAVVTLRSARYRVGQVVAYRNQVEDRTVVHRIIWTDGRHFAFKGDHNRLDDSLIAKRSAIVGRKVAVLPLMGWPWTPTLVAALVLLALWAPTPLMHSLRRRRHGSPTTANPLARWHHRSPDRPVL